MAELKTFAEVSMATDPHEWPAFTTPLLQAVSAEFRGRRKAIRHHARDFSCILEFDETAERTYERINIDYEGLLGLKLRFSLWDDGTMWLRACVPCREKNAAGPS